MRAFLIVVILYRLVAFIGAGDALLWRARNGRRSIAAVLGMAIDLGIIAWALVLV